MDDVALFADLLCLVIALDLFTDAVALTIEVLFPDE